MCTGMIWGLILGFTLLLSMCGCVFLHNAFWNKAYATSAESEKKAIRIGIAFISCVAIVIICFCLFFIVNSLHKCPSCSNEHSEGCLCEVCKPHEENCSCDNCFLKYYYKSVHHGKTCTCDDCTRYNELRGR